MEERLARIETMVEEIYHRLFGNGQPGELDRLNSRVGKLENWRWWVMGIAVGAGIACGYGLNGLLQALAK